MGIIKIYRRLPWTSIYSCQTLILFNRFNYYGEIITCSGYIVCSQTKRKYKLHFKVSLKFKFNGNIIFNQDCNLSLLVFLSNIKSTYKLADIEIKCFLPLHLKN